MILGPVCTRSCSFCAVRKGEPSPGADLNEPLRIKEAVKRLNLNYSVVTSPTRDDLPDGGAEVFYRTIKAIKSLGPERKVEVLIPDFGGKKYLIQKVTSGCPEVIAHNLETVPSLYIKVRKGAGYRRSLSVLEAVKEINPRIFTKSGLMLGLGETAGEVRQVLKDLAGISCDFLTLGQYLPPSLEHFPLKEYVSPEKFTAFRAYALNLGFKDVKSSPYVRSSYLAQSAWS